MAFVEIPEAWEVAMNGSYVDTNHKWAMVWGVHDNETHDLARASVVAGVFKDWWVDSYRGAITDRVQLDSIRITDQESDSGVSAVYTIGLPSAGNSATPPSAAQSAMIVTLLTAGRGRKNRGRKYLPGLPAGAQNAADGTQWDADQPALYGGLVVDLIDAIDLISPAFALAVLSRVDAEAKVVTSVIARRNMGTQRRRVRQ